MLASGFGSEAKVLGSDVHEVPAVNADQVLAFVSQLAKEPPEWCFNAAEQLEAFLAMGWPKKPDELH